MWQIIKKVESKLTKYKITKNNGVITFQEVINLWTNSTVFRQFFSELLKDSPYEAYFWEVKPVTLTSLTNEFEFVLVNSKVLAQITANKSAFSDFFNTQDLVVSFF